jgi:copper chaperone CopZ
MKQTITVKGMHCKSCSILISEALEESGAKDVSVKLDEKKQIGTVTLNSALSKDKLKTIIREQGEYQVL